VLHWQPIIKNSRKDGQSTSFAEGRFMTEKKKSFQLWTTESRERFWLLKAAVVLKLQWDEKRTCGGTTRSRHRSTYPTKRTVGIMSEIAGSRERGEERELLGQARTVKVD